jgi:histidinol-phosphate/aromatic aminotransferase/cobyric acid decarboxylase-like protein
MAGPPSADLHGGNRIAIARRLGCRPEQLLEASASLVPFGPPARLRRALQRVLAAGGVPLDPLAAWPAANAVQAALEVVGLAPAKPCLLRDYPDRSYGDLRQAIAAHHGLDPAAVLPGNGAAELFTWAARDAAANGLSLLPSPGFADYRRALSCWGGRWRDLPLPLRWGPAFPQPFPFEASTPAAPSIADRSAAERSAAERSAVQAAGSLWITNPHNPTGQLWSRASLEPLLARFALVIVDEAFLPLVPGGEAQSLVPLLADHPNLVVIRSLTKLFAIAGLRLGYALADPKRLARWASWRDPWPVNGLAALAGELLLGDAAGLKRWLARVHGWVATEGPWLAERLAAEQGLVPLPSASNFLLVRGELAGQQLALEPLRLALQERHRILVRDCRSFEGLGEGWLRIALLDRSGNRRLLKALRREEIPRCSPAPR